MFGLRECLLLALLSMLLVVLSRSAFRTNAASRRLFVLNAGLLFVVLPLLLSGFSVRWQLGLTNPPDWIAATAFPMPLLIVLPIGGLVFSLVVFARVCRVRWQLQTLPLLQDVGVRQIAEEYQHALRTRRDVRFRTGLAPCSVSLGVATVVLPDDWHAWDEKTLRGVIAHELVHVARRDDLWLLLLRLLAAGYWWLPWLRLLVRDFDRAMEESCDDLASGILRSDADYLSAVYRVVQASHHPPLTSLPNLGKHPLVGRFHRFQGYRDREMDFRGLFWSGLGLSLTISLLWTMEPVGVPSRQAEPLRIVAVAATGSLEHFEIRLRPRDRGPPTLETPALAERPRR